MECPYCESDDLKEDAAINDGETFDYGCRSCRRVFDAPDPEAY